jgi:hypothetical protein
MPGFRHMAGSALKSTCCRTASMHKGVYGLQSRKVTPMTSAKTILLICLLLFSAAPLGAQQAELSGLNVANTRDDLLVYFNLEGAFSAEITEAILSGVETIFYFQVNLYRVRGLWFDSTITERELVHTVKFDHLKKEFTVQRSWETAKKPYVTKDFQEAQQRMSKIDGLKVVPLENLDKGQHYRLEAKAEVSKLTLPFYLHYILFSLWDVETDWYTVNFVY